MPPVCNPDEQALPSERRVFSWSLGSDCIRATNGARDLISFRFSLCQCEVFEVLWSSGCTSLRALRLLGSGFALWSVLTTLLSARRHFKQSALLSSRMFKTWSISEFLYLWPKSTSIENVLSHAGFLLCFYLAGAVHPNILLQTSQLLWI